MEADVQLGPEVSKGSSPASVSMALRLFEASGSPM